MKATKTKQLSDDMVPEDRVEIGGSICDEQGQSIPDVKLDIYWEIICGGMSRCDRTNTKTEKTGLWSCQIPKDTKRVSIKLWHNFFSPLGFDYNPPMEKLLEKTSVMMMKTGLTLTGKVIDAFGKPIANALLMPTHSVNRVNPDKGLVETPYTARTDSDGIFTLTGLKKEAIEIVVDADGFAPAIVDVNMDIPEIKPVTFTLHPGGTLSGIVTDMHGQPIQNVKIKMDHWKVKIPKEKCNQSACCDFKNYQILRRETRSDEKGLFELKGLPSFGELQTLFFEPSRTTYLPCVLYIPMPHTQKIEVVLYPLPVFSGKVLDKQTKEPIKNFSITAGFGDKEGEPIHWRLSPKESYLDKNQFECSVTSFIPSGPEVVAAIRIDAKGYHPCICSRRIDQTPEPVVVELEKGTPVTGIVKSVEGLFVQDAEVVFSGFDTEVYIENGTFPPWGRRPHYFVRTSAQGQFELPPLNQPGEIIILHETGYAILNYPEFVSGSECLLTPWAKVNGKITSDKGFAEETSIGFAQDKRTKISWIIRNTIHADGSFLLNYIPAIPLTLYCRHKRQETILLQAGQAYRFEQINDQPGQWEPQPDFLNVTTDKKECDN